MSTPLYMGDAVLTIDADDYAAEVSSVILTPSASIATWRGLTPEATYTRASTATWTANITLAQDYDTATSLARYLFENEGEVVEANFTPISGGVGFDVTLVITPGAIGGATDNFAEASVSLGVQGRPDLVIPEP